MEQKKCSMGVSPMIAVLRDVDRQKAEERFALAMSPGVPDDRAEYRRMGETPM